MLRKGPFFITFSFHFELDWRRLVAIDHLQFSGCFNELVGLEDDDLVKRNVSACQVYLVLPESDSLASNVVAVLQNPL